MASETMIWCKSRALALVELGKLGEAFASMVSDLGKDADTEHVTRHPSFPVLLMVGQKAVLDRDAAELRRWVEGF